MPIENSNVRVVDVIEQCNDSKYSVLKKIFLIAGSKGRCPLKAQTFESSTLLNNITTQNVRFYKRLPEVRVGAH